MSKSQGSISLVPGVLVTVPSKSTPGETHDLRLSKNGLIYCDCSGFRWRGLCSHLLDFVKQNPTAKALVKASLYARIDEATKSMARLESI